ncbi:PepSY domain-containing protein [Catenovulum adriaticum]|uniref:PepSY domain-containing protein n=1 Tax=Catenovulum adriaticum TaxID=2984846 RepID=A0ABY7AP80_9ALTE|nr:PepSY domain-containing protein [Catenovulum sp. TS8]WAJ71115.1 PepSY domain-containing protein [Catenovulum sp. TS8]
MFKQCRLLFLTISLIASLCLISPVQAQTMSMRHAVNSVQQVYQGKLLKAYKTRIKQQTYYRIKMLMPSGRVVSILINAHTGKMQKE